MAKIPIKLENVQDGLRADVWDSYRDLVAIAGWHDAELDPPPDSFKVLAITKEPGGYFHRIGSYDAPCWSIDGLRGGPDPRIRVLWWTLLPAWPQIGDNVIVKSEWRHNNDHEETDGTRGGAAAQPEDAEEGGGRRL